MSRALRILTLAGIAYVLWEYLKDTMGDKGPNRPAAPVAGEPQRPPQAGTGPATAAENEAGAEGSAAEGPTKAELYERATELGIKGRSSMSKAELERAIRDAS
ncbi:MAG: Rho termination factor N-terminal domain-containing protein [Solirubrobacterales bacterium]